MFIETRSGLINIAPCGRSASADERDEFEKYDKVCLFFFLKLFKAVIIQ